VNSRDLNLARNKMMSLQLLPAIEEGGSCHLHRRALARTLRLGI
jgi:hypothetical protein